MAIFPSKEFPGIAFSYDPSAQPFFKALVKENLRKLSLLKTGKKLLKYIAEAKPTYRGKEKPDGVNVIIQPPLARQFSAPGLVGGAGGSAIKIGDQASYDAWFNGKGGKLMPSISSKISAQEDNSLQKIWRLAVRRLYLLSVLQQFRDAFEGWNVVASPYYDGTRTDSLFPFHDRNRGSRL